MFAVSPDARLLVYETAEEIYVRRFDQLQATPLRGTEGGHSPFFSPDGEWVAFFTPTLLKKTPLRGGAPTTVARVANGRSGAWAPNGEIVFDVIGPTGLLAISSDGGVPREITKLGEDEVDHGHIGGFLPDSQRVTFGSAVGPWDDGTILAHSLTDGSSTKILEGGEHGIVTKSGHLVYARGGSLLAVRIDPETLSISRQPTAVIDDVLYPSDGADPQFSLPRSGNSPTSRPRRGDVSTNWFGSTDPARRRSYPCRHVRIFR